MSTLIQALNDSATQDGSQVSAAAYALSDWAKTELAWLNGESVPKCLEPARDAYSLGLRDIGLGAISIGIALIGTPSTVDVERSAAQVERGRKEVVSAAALAIVTSCDGGQTPAPSAVKGADAPVAFQTLADDVNQRFADLEASGRFTSDPRAYAEDLLTLETDVASALAALPRAEDFQVLRESTDTVVSALRDAAASISPDDARGRLVTARLSIFDEGVLLGDAVTQREAAAAVRRAFGLPPLTEGDIL